MRRIGLPVAVAALFGVAVGCGSPRSGTPNSAAGARRKVLPWEVATEGPPRVVEVSLAQVGLHRDTLDRSADPCQDFYQFACGGWLARTEIPHDRGRWDRFAQVRERNHEVARQILDRAAARPRDKVDRALGLFFRACLDQQAVERAGISAIEPLLAIINRSKTASSISAAFAALQARGIPAPFALYVVGDFRDPSTNVLFLDSAGLGLPDRDFYLDDKSGHFATTRAAYREHMQRMFRLLAMSRRDAQRAAADVLALETELAKATRSREEKRDAAKLYNRIDQGELAKLAPHLDWKLYFSTLGHPNLRGLSVTTPEFLSRLSDLLAGIKPPIWRQYLTWHVLHATAEALPEEFVREHFVLVSHLTGQKHLEPRWKHCVRATSDAMGDYLGQRFVAERFDERGKTAAETLVHEVSAAFRARLGELAWMTDAAKKEAVAKLDQVSYLIGYPQAWKEYHFALEEGQYAANVLRARAFDVAQQLDKVDRLRDRGEWHWPPQVVNAGYRWLENQMIFPAGILQEPFFSADHSAAVNLGSIGTMIGHELTHGFDDQGAKFDGRGALHDWWEPHDVRQFAARGQCLVAQYDGYEPLPGAKINGRLTLAENIADLGGIALAYRAYRRLRDDALVRIRAEGFNEDQQFFLAVASMRCAKYRDAELQHQLLTDPHSPPRYRINGTLRNLPEFAAAFQCNQGAPMRAKATCEIW